MATTQPDSFELAGQKGVGVLAFLVGIELPAFGRRIQAYKKALEACQPVGALVNDQVGAFSMTLCAPSKAKARELAEHAVVWYMERALEFFAGWGKPGAQVPKGYEWYAKATQLGSEKLSERAKFDYLDANDMILVGDPDTLIERLQKYETIGVDEILMFQQMGRVPHQAIMDSIKLIGKEVMPYFRNMSRAAPEPVAATNP